MIPCTNLGYNIEGTYDYLRGLLLRNHEQGKIVDTGHWQALRNVPHTRTLELQNVSIEMDIRPTPGSWASFIRPNLPWAEDHFQERVAGDPLNPGEQYKNWPWYRGGVEDHKSTCCENPIPGPLVKDRCLTCGGLLKATGRFSHSYMERFWPKFAGYENEPAIYRKGIRYRYGDLEDLIQILKRDPYTRQAYLPIWFPEDLTASRQDERVPCTLGYHFMLRDDRLHCFYPMRSCDIVRYFRDDAYMAGRLCQWIIANLAGEEIKTWQEQTDEHASTVPGFWTEIQPGKLTMSIASLHCFEGDIPKLKRDHNNYRSEDESYGAAV